MRCHIANNLKTPIAYNTYFFLLTLRDGGFGLSAVAFFSTVSLDRLHVPGPSLKDPSLAHVLLMRGQRSINTQSN